MPDIFDTEVNPQDYFNYKQSNYRNFNNNKRNSSLIFDEPKMIGYFSVNEYREFVSDASQLKYLKMPSTRNLQLDLNNGIKDFRPKPESVKRERMDFMLRFIVNNIEKLKVQNGYRCHNKLLRPDIICSRGRLVQIMCPQYKTQDKWSLIVSRYKGNTYISQPDGDDFHTIQSMYGYKFEQYLMSGNPLDEPTTDVPVIESEEFYGVFESQIGNIALLYNAEMDGLDSLVQIDLSETTDLDKLKFVELKTSLFGPTDNRHCRWWAQSYLAGVSNICVGYRTEGGIITKIEKLPIDMLKSQTNWSPNKCIELLKSFLNSVHWVCRNENCPDSVYKFDYNYRLNKTIQCTIFKGKNEYSFLPDWYISEMDNLV